MGTSGKIGATGSGGLLSTGQQGEGGTIPLRFNGVTQAAEPGTFDDLPEATIPCLFTHLSGADLARFSCVSKDWKQLGKREEQKRIKAFNEKTRSIAEMMKEPTAEQQKCLDALKSLSPNDIGQAIQTLRPKIINKKTESAKIDSILQNAIITNKIDDALLALIFGADVDKFASFGTTFLQTPLYRAAFNGHAGIVKALIGAGADINKPDSSGATALFGAAFNGHTGIVKALLEAGADIKQVSVHETSALYWAAFHGHTETMQTLLEAGAGVHVNKANISGYTPLSAAARNGHIETVQALLEVGADVNKADFFGVTPLFGATVRGDTKMVKVLLAAGATVDEVDSSRDTLLYLAARNGHAEIVKALLDAGADVNKTNLAGVTPLSAAALKGHAEIVKALLDAGADVNKTNLAGVILLSAGALNGHAEIVDMLKKAAQDRE